MISKVQNNSFGVRLYGESPAKIAARKLEEGRKLAPDLAMDIALRDLYQKQQEQAAKSAQPMVSAFESFQHAALQAISGGFPPKGDPAMELDKRLSASAGRISLLG